MALESGTYISDLVPTNPAHTDGVNQADSHLRLIKAAIKATFPNISGAVTASHTLLNSVAAAFNTVGSLVLPGETPLTLENSGGALGVSGAVIAPSIQATTGVSIAGRDVGEFLIPAGAIVAWSGAATALPSKWALCDGTNNTPDLRGRFIIGAAGDYAVGVVGGAASASTDSQGSHAHTGQVSEAGGFNINASTDQQGSHAHSGNTQGYALLASDLPAHAHPQAQSSEATISTSPSGTTMVVTSINGLSAVNGPNTGSTGGGNAHSHAIGTDGSHAHSVTLSQGNHSHAIQTDGAHTHSVPTLPPYFALCYIMKL